MALAQSYLSRRRQDSLIAKNIGDEFTADQNQPRYQDKPYDYEQKLFIINSPINIKS